MSYVLKLKPKAVKDLKHPSRFVSCLKLSAAMKYVCTGLSIDAMLTDEKRTEK